MNLKENQNSILHGMVMVAREPDLVLKSYDDFKSLKGLAQKLRPFVF